jgi:Na+-driven multidrug efflux pump
MVLGQTALVIVLSVFLAFGGWTAILIGRMLRDRTDARDTAGNVLILAALFGVVAILMLTFWLEPLEELLRQL